MVFICVVGQDVQPLPESASQGSEKGQLSETVLPNRHVVTRPVEKYLRYKTGIVNMGSLGNMRNIAFVVSLFGGMAIANAGGCSHTTNKEYHSRGE